MHELGQSVQRVAVARLKDNPRNKQVHADFDPAGRDAWLVEDIRTHGILLPALVFPDGTIDDGHRRKWAAAYLKMSTIPAIVLAPTDHNAAFSSAQLHRTMSLFAKCVLYRQRLAELVAWGSDAAKRNLRHNAPHRGNPGDAADLNQAWIKTEEVLGVSRRNLTAGVKLLEKLDLMTGKGGADAERAARVASIFRNRGLRPALRMLGERGQAGADEIDCIDWESDDDATDSPVVKSPRKQQAEQRILKTAKKDKPQLPAWAEECVKYLGHIETAARKNNAHSPTLGDLLNKVEGEIVAAAQFQQDRKAA